MAELWERKTWNSIIQDRLGDPPDYIIFTSKTVGMQKYSSRFPFRQEPTDESRLKTDNLKNCYNMKRQCAMMTAETAGQRKTVIRS